MGTGTSGVTYQLGETGGTESVTLTTQQIPAHRHSLVASTAIATESSPEANVVAQSSAIDLFVEDDATAGLAPNAVSSIGGSQPHENVQPYLAVNFIISLFGAFPPPT
jgi:microcystin-dependent protein